MLPRVLQDVLHAVIELSLAVNVDTPRLTLAGLTVTGWVCVRVPEPVTAALIVLPSALVDENVAEKTPLPFDVPEADGANPLLVPVEESVTVLPLITLPN